METDVRFRSYDGVALSGTLCTPEGETRAAVLLVHGITSNRNEFGLYSGLAQHLADASIASFRFDYRAHGESTLPLHEMTLSGIVNDICAAYKEFTRAFAHPNVPFAVVGMSFGGGVSAVWAAKNGDKVNLVILLAPVLDYEHDILGQYGSLTEPGLSTALTERLAGKGYIDVDGISYGRALINELPLFSVKEDLKRLSCPALIIHGDLDSIVPYDLSREFVKHCQNCRLITISGTDHGFGVPADEDLTWPETKAHHRIVYEHIVAAVRGME